MATGSYDANGIWQYGEDDNIALFSDLLKLGTASTSSAFTADRARLATLEANSIAGSIPAKPSSVVVATGTAAVSTLGMVTFTGATSISLNGVFTSNFKRYKVVYSLTNSSGGANFSFRLRNSGTDLSAANSYYSASYRFRSDSSTVINAGSDNTAVVLSGGSSASTNMAGETNIYDPQVSTAKTMFSGNHVILETNTLSYMQLHGAHTQGTGTYDSLTFYPSAGNFTGSMVVYGLTN